jgi:pimeloyl-ACP methyl ester carboxylesterase
LPEIDRQTLARPALHETLLVSWSEAFRGGMRGMVWDGCLYAWPWGFQVEQITIPVQLWHGELDANVPVSMGRNLARRTSNCTARFYPDEGHFSLPFGRINEIVQELLTSDL